MLCCCCSLLTQQVSTPAPVQDVEVAVASADMQKPQEQTDQPAHDVQVADGDDVAGTSDAKLHAKEWSVLFLNLVFITPRLQCDDPFVSRETGSHDTCDSRINSITTGDKTSEGNRFILNEEL
jgi:hypothetical protein